MIIKKLTQVGSPIIRKKSTVVKDIKSKKIQRIIKNLVDSMKYGNLVGLAAPQIGINLQIFVTEIRTTNIRKVDEKMDADRLRVFINPKIISVSKDTWSRYEGCGSVAVGNIFGTVKRPTSIVIKAQDKNGKIFVLKAKNLLARVILHEFDHLNGKIFLDRLTDTKSFMSRNEYKQKYYK